MRSIFALSMLALAGLSAAQDQQQQNYPYTIDPNSVSSADRRKPHVYVMPMFILTASRKMV